MKKAMNYKVWKMLPVAATVTVVATVVTLGGCGGSDSSGGGGDNFASSNNGSGSIVACFTVSDGVNFSVTASGVPAGQIFPNRSMTGPMTYNGQSVTGQTLFYPSGNTTYTVNDYWAVTNNGVTLTATVNYNGTVTPDGTFLPYNMSPGQTATNSSNDVSTFVGFETLTLAGQTFSNTCHFSDVDHLGNQANAWYAPEYGIIKNSADGGGTWQYDGDL
jgi:hypothetical protein